MMTDMELYVKLETLAHDGGKGSAGASMRNLVLSPNESKQGRSVGLQSKNSGDYFFAILMDDQTIDVVEESVVSRPAVYIAHVKKYDGNFTASATAFLKSNNGPGETVNIVDEENMLKVLESAAKIASEPLAKELKRYIDYLRS